MDLSLNPPVLPPNASPLNLVKLHLQTGWSPGGPSCQPLKGSSHKHMGSWGQELGYRHKAEGIGNGKQVWVVTGEKIKVLRSEWSLGSRSEGRGWVVTGE